MRRLFVFLLAGLLFCLFPAGAFAADMQTISTEEAALAGQEAIELSLAEHDDPRRHEVELTKSPIDINVPVGVVTYDVVMPYGVRFGSATAVYVTVIVDGAPYRRLLFNYKVHIYDKVVVAAKNLQPRRLLEFSDVRLEERDVSNVRAKYLTDPELAIGREANRLIKNGMIITKSMVINPVVIEAGATITILAEKNGVKVRTEGIALERGREEAVIRVRNANSSRVLRAKVIDATTVQIVI